MQKFVLAVTAVLGLLGSVAAFAQAPSPITWAATSGGNIPPTAVAAGKEANGQPLFLCRAKYGPDNGVHPGKTRREFNGCNIGWGGKEVAVAQYEVAVSLPAGATWQPTTGANIPATAIMGGQEAAGGLAICRVNYQGGVHMGKTRAAFNGCNIGWGGQEVAIPQYEILVMAPQAAAPVAAAVPFMGCQQMSNTLGTDHGVTWGSANALQQQQWQANGCNTRPQAAAPVPAPATGAAAAWTPMPGAAVDIGAAGTGQAWVTNKGQNIYRWVNNNWTQMPGAAVRVAVDPSGNAWVVNAGGGIYHWENNNWKQIPGGLTDIGVGGPAPNGTVWGVNAGQEIFRLKGTSWEKMPGAAVRVAVDPAGNAWVVNSGGGIYTWVNNNWVQRPGAAKDVAVCGTGAVYVIGTDNAPYKWNGTNNWDKQPGGPLLNIACDGTGRLYATTPTEQILTAGPATATAPAPAPTPGAGVKCADENGTCALTGPSSVMYGKNSTWVTRNATAPGIACNNATFGDPLVGTVKECRIVGAPAPAPAPTPVDASAGVKCADENGTCAVTGPSTVMYGKNSTWVTRPATAPGIACNNATFGDPLYGTVKECRIVGGAPAPASAWVKCADENGTCAVTGPSSVIYGKNTTWVVRNVTTPSIACNNATFGDPLVGTVKECRAVALPR